MIQKIKHCSYCHSDQHDSGDHRSGIDKRQTLAIALPGSVPGLLPTAKEVGHGWQTVAPDTTNVVPTHPVQQSCQVCGVRIKEGALWLKVSVVLVSAVLPDYGDDDEELKRDMVFYFCAKCSTSLPILTLPNALCTAAQTEEVTKRVEEITRREEEDVKDDAWNELVNGVSEKDLRYDEMLVVGKDPELRAIAMMEAEKQRQAQDLKSAAEQHSGQALQAGDAKPFNRVMPIGASRRDVLSNAVLASDLPNFDNFNSTMRRRVRPGAPAASSGEAGQRERLGRYLADPRSRGILRPGQREALRLYAGGATQSDVGMDQGNFSKLLKATLAKADLLFGGR